MEVSTAFPEVAIQVRRPEHNACKVKFPSESVVDSASILGGRGTKNRRLNSGEVISLTFALETGFDEDKYTTRPE
jgi:hypothetical protein